MHNNIMKSSTYTTVKEPCPVSTFIVTPYTAAYTNLMLQCSNRGSTLARCRNFARLCPLSVRTFTNCFPTVALTSVIFMNMYYTYGGKTFLWMGGMSFYLEELMHEHSYDSSKIVQNNKWLICRFLRKSLE